MRKGDEKPVIHFKLKLINKAEALKNIVEFADAFSDLSRIDHAIKHLYSQQEIEDAQKLDDELYVKYPEISMILNIAKTMPKTNKPLSNCNDQQIPIVANLNQDRFGIYAHILLNSKDINEISDFIDYVND